MRRALLALLVTAIVLGGAFAGATVGQIFFHRAERQVIPFHTIWWGASGLADNVITDQATWERDWKQVFCSLSVCTPAPEINFTLRTVLSVDRWEPTAGYAVNITQVTKTGSSIEVNVVVTEPGPSCAVAEVISDPSHIADIPRVAGHVLFTFQTSFHNCGG